MEFLDGLQNVLQIDFAILTDGESFYVIKNLNSLLKKIHTKAVFEILKSVTTSVFKLKMELVITFDLYVLMKNGL